MTDLRQVRGRPARPLSLWDLSAYAPAIHSSPHRPCPSQRRAEATRRRTLSERRDEKFHGVRGYGAGRAYHERALRRRAYQPLHLSLHGRRLPHGGHQATSDIAGGHLARLSDKASTASQIPPDLPVDQAEGVGRLFRKFKSIRAISIIRRGSTRSV
jgi:hypothetical protein